MNIIAVDDEKMPLKACVDAIKEVSPESVVHDFSSATEAVAYAKSERVDVAFLDIHMKTTDGIAAAELLKKINPHVNIIFVTGYDEFQKAAFSMHASGYILKPATPEAVKEELDNLRYEVPANKTGNRIQAKTFGSFELIVDGNKVNFSRSLSKELLAYLIDKQGDRVTRQEISVLLFWDEDYSRKTQDYLSKIFKGLMDSLKAVHAEDIIIKDHNSYSVDVTKFDCDAYRYLKGDPEAVNAFLGEYMSQYVWNDTAIDKFYK